MANRKFLLEMQSGYYSKETLFQRGSNSFGSIEVRSSKFGVTGYSLKFRGFTLSDLSRSFKSLSKVFKIKTILKRRKMFVDFYESSLDS